MGFYQGFANVTGSLVVARDGFESSTICRETIYPGVQFLIFSVTARTAIYPVTIIIGLPVQFLNGISGSKYVVPKHPDKSFANGIYIVRIIRRLRHPEKF